MHQMAQMRCEVAQDAPNAKPGSKVDISRQLTKTKMCMHFLKGKCRYGQECSYAHNEIELKGRPNLRKTRICKNFEMGSCDNPFCAFAHGSDELRGTDGVWKTVLCAKWLNNTCRAGPRCRFAHGQHELNVNPNAGQDSPDATPLNVQAPGDENARFGGSNNMRSDGTPKMSFQQQDATPKMGSVLGVPTMNYSEMPPAYTEEQLAQARQAQAQLANAHQAQAQAQAHHAVQSAWGGFSSPAAATQAQGDSYGFPPVVPFESRAAAKSSMAPIGRPKEEAHPTAEPESLDIMASLVKMISDLEANPDAHADGTQSPPLVPQSAPPMPSKWGVAPPKAPVSPGRRPTAASRAM